MAKAPTLTTITSGYYSSTTLNNNFDAIETAFENTVSRDGSTPNTMSADFDMNGNDILNVGTITADEYKLLVDDVPTDLTSVGGILSQASGGTGASTIGAATVVVGDGTTRTITEKLEDVLTSDDIPVADLANDAFVLGSKIHVRSGEDVFLDCDPSSGDDLGDMYNWISGGHYVEQGGDLRIRIANGLQDINENLKLEAHRRVSITGTSTPDTRTITGYTVTSLGSDLYELDVTVSSAMPSRCVPDFVVGFVPLATDGLVEGFSGCYKIYSIAVDLLSFKVRARIHGTAPSSASTLTSTTRCGFATNTVYIPQCTLRADAEGWPGGSDEGLFNVWEFAGLTLRNIGITITGTEDGNEEMMYAARMGGIYCLDYVFACGAPRRQIRLGQHGKVLTNRSMFSGDTDSDEVFQSNKGEATFLNTILSGGDTSCVTAGNASFVLGTAAMAVGSPNGLRTTGALSLIKWDSGFIRHCGDAMETTGGMVAANTITDIQYCDNPIVLVNSDDLGWATGDPAISNCTNPAITANLWTGGKIWFRDFTNPQIEEWQSIGRVASAYDFPSISAHSYADSTAIALTGVRQDDQILVTRRGGLPAQNISFEAYYSADDQVKIRCYNHSTGAIDPASVVFIISAFRTTA